MSILVTGTPGSGKTTLTQYARDLGDSRFFDTDEIPGLCEWREFETGNVLGLVTEFLETGKDDWYKKYGWYWRVNRLKEFLDQNPDAILCGSSENIVDCYPMFESIIILKLNEKELLSNLSSPKRLNPFGKTPQQRANFMNWQNYLIESANQFTSKIIEGNNTTKAYSEIETI